MRLSDYKGEAVIDLIGEIVEPIGALFKDEEIVSLFSKKGNNEPRNITEIVKIACKNHKNDIMEILAAINGQTVEQYQPTLTEFIAQAVFLFKDLTKDIMTVFTSSEQKTEKESFGSATENTPANEN